MPWISCKFELELKWTKYYVFSAVGNDNTNDNINRHKTILYVPVVTLSTRENQNYQNFLVKDLKISLLE